MDISEGTEYWLNINSFEEVKDKVITGDWEETTKKHLEILKKLDIQKTDIVLDFGCGIGRLMKPLKNQCKQIVGTDISDKILSYAINYLDYGCLFKSLKDETGGGLPIEYADKIYSLIVIQHIEKHKAVRALINLNNCLKIGGKMLIQFPNLDRLEEMYSSHMIYKHTIGALQPRMEFYTEKELNYIFKILNMKFEVFEEETDLYVLAEKRQNMIPEDYMLEGDRWK